MSCPNCDSLAESLAYDIDIFMCPKIGCKILYFDNLSRPIRHENGEWVVYTNPYNQTTESILIELVDRVVILK